MKSLPQIDIRALLLIALDDKPPDNLPDRVMARVALLTTVLEFGRLLTAAPIDALSRGRGGGDPNDDGNDGSGT
ncbi:MAG: hypothetical protein QM756_29230 [Polyangiaceae bacterium]